MWRPHNTKLDWLTAVPIAHRGLHSPASAIVENSLPAFQAAMQHGYAIECDLQLSRDGEAMVFHDHTLERLTHAQGDVSAYTASQLSKIGYKAGQGTIPTLDMMLDLVNGKAGLVIELKSRWDGDTRLVQRVSDVLASYNGPAAIMSFDPVPVAWAAAHAPHLLRGIVADGATDQEYDILPLQTRLSLRQLSHTHLTKPDFLSLWREWLPSSASRQARQNHMPLICWTTRTEQQASDALRWCDQVTFEGYLPKAP